MFISQMNLNLINSDYAEVLFMQHYDLYIVCWITSVSNILNCIFDGLQYD
jgi:hypothetical protein